MKAAQYKTYGSPEVLEIVTTDVPKIKPGHVLIKVKASSVNAADILVRSGKIKFLSGKKFPKGTGFDFAGNIVEIGSSNTNFKLSDEVWGFINNIKQTFPGVTSEYLLAPINAIAHKPTTIDAVSAAAISGAGGAALGVLNQGNIKKGEKILIRGGAGGVGSLAVQIVHSMGAHVTALTGEKHLQKVLDLGADKSFDYKTTKPNELGQFDVIFDTVGKNIKAYRKLLRPYGRYLAITVGGFSELLYVFVSKIFGKRRVRFIQMPPDGKLLTDLAEYVDTKGLQPLIEKVYPMEEIALAHREMEAGGSLGKRVINIATTNS